MYMRVPPVENPTFLASEEYEKVPKTLPFYFTENYGKWVSSKLSGVSGALGAEVIELRNWLLHCWCLSE